MKLREETDKSINEIGNIEIYDVEKDAAPKTLIPVIQKKLVELYGSSNASAMIKGIKTITDRYTSTGKYDFTGKELGCFEPMVTKCSITLSVTLRDRGLYMMLEYRYFHPGKMAGSNGYTVVYVYDIYDKNWKIK